MNKYYNIYLVEKHNSDTQYIAKDLKKNTLHVCNFDVDTNGGLKLVLLDNTVNTTTIDKVEPILENVTNFIPVNAYQVTLLKDNELYVPRVFYDIFTNKYLKNKEKYVLWDGVVQKVNGGYIFEEYKFGYEYPTFEIVS